MSSPTQVHRARVAREQQIARSARALARSRATANISARLASVMQTSACADDDRLDWQCARANAILKSTRARAYPRESVNDVRACQHTHTHAHTRCLRAARNSKTRNRNAAAMMAGDARSSSHRIARARPVADVHSNCTFSFGPLHRHAALRHFAYLLAHARAHQGRAHAAPLMSAAHLCGARAPNELCARARAGQFIRRRCCGPRHKCRCSGKPAAAAAAQIKINVSVLRWRSSSCGSLPPLSRAPA